jgi:hypothetical protein
VLPSYWPVKARVFPSGEKRGIAGDPPRHAALCGHREEVAGVAEDDLVAVDRREPEQPRLGRLRADRTAKGQETTEPRARRESRQDKP